jgi:hypothetical protein
MELTLLSLLILRPKTVLKLIFSGGGLLSVVFIEAWLSVCCNVGGLKLDLRNIIEFLLVTVLRKRLVLASGFMVYSIMMSFSFSY